jgi:hypothetical protein
MLAELVEVLEVRLAMLDEFEETVFCSEVTLVCWAVNVVACEELLVCNVEMADVFEVTCVVNDPRAAAVELAEVSSLVARVCSAVSVVVWV